MTKLDLDELERLDKEATPGPWARTACTTTVEARVKELKEALEAVEENGAIAAIADRLDALSAARAALSPKQQE